MTTRVRGLCLQANKAVVFDKKEMIRLADQWEMTVMACPQDTGPKAFLEKVEKPAKGAGWFSFAAKSGGKG